MVHWKWDHTRPIRVVLPLLYTVYRTDLSSNMGEENTPCDCVGIHWNHHRFREHFLAVRPDPRNDEYSDATSHQRSNPHHDTFGNPILILDWKTGRHQQSNLHDLDDGGLPWWLSIVAR